MGRTRVLEPRLECRSSRALGPQAMAYNPTQPPVEEPWARMCLLLPSFVQSEHTSLGRCKDYRGWCLGSSQSVCNTRPDWSCVGREREKSRKKMRSGSRWMWSGSHSSLFHFPAVWQAGGFPGPGSPGLLGW